MDFSRPASLGPLLQTARAFLDREIIPLEPLFHGSFRALEPKLDALREKVRALGLFSPHVPKEHGGAGLPLAEFAHLAEVLGRSPLGHYVFNCQAPDAGNMELLGMFGS